MKKLLALFTLLLSTPLYSMDDPPPLIKTKTGDLTLTKITNKVVLSDDQSTITLDAQITYSVKEVKEIGAQTANFKKLRITTTLGLVIILEINQTKAKAYLYAYADEENLTQDTLEY